MLKIQEPNDDHLLIYYTYVRDLKHLFQLFALEDPNLIEINVQ